ncbi:hypothetical protein FcAc13_05430 [Frischella sp. Ac13]|uniref:Uncharacterized protein n=1 Tax=Frischella japonica TaxID=2741544 RepID=A0ABR7QX25_9GAMM|nr:hypothetical protein [Frischella japonica]MBC9130750.1 hypothetical protein [Frischella japonica]
MEDTTINADKLASKIENILLKKEEEISNREEINHITIKKVYANYIHGYNVYMSIGIKEKYLNEKDVDLFDIIFDVIDKKEIVYVNGNFILSNGENLNELIISGKEDILLKIDSFISSCLKKYENVINDYINY